MFALAVLAIVLGAPPPVDDDLGRELWYKVNRDGYTYLMPPIMCRMAAIPPYTLTFLPQETMDTYWGPNTYGRFQRHSDISAIYISSDLPKAVADDTLVHELAHLRGCRH